LTSPHFSAIINTTKGKETKIMTIWFDMDGTIADLYGVENWLDYLLSGNAYPYKNAKPLINMNLLARYLNKLQKMGFQIGIISWLSKGSNEEYNKKVTDAKVAWLKKHLKSVNFNHVNIVNYGYGKYNFCTSENDILFDDEEKNRSEWTGKAYNVNNILNVLKGLAVAC
jgi:hypothetical protein